MLLALQIQSVHRAIQRVRHVLGGLKPIVCLIHVNQGYYMIPLLSYAQQLVLLGITAINPAALNRVKSGEFVRYVTRDVKHVIIL